MRMSKLLIAVAATSMIASPALANSAAPLSIAKVSDVKASTTSTKTNKGASGTLVGLLALAAIGGGIYAAASSDSP